MIEAALEMQVIVFPLRNFAPFAVKYFD